MLTREEAQRIAAAINALRPDWGVNGLMTVLGDERIRLRRTYRDTVIAFSALACDTTSRKPTRIHEHGPWWELTRPLSPSSEFRTPDPEDCATCSKPKEARHLDHEYEPMHARTKGVGPTEEQRAAIRAALTKPDATEDDMADDRRAEGEIA